MEERLEVLEDLDDLRQIACRAIDDIASELNDLSQAIWTRPELAYEEHHAHSLLTDFLLQKGFTTEPKYHLETAFRASYGAVNRPNIALICEYDALPVIGHACGHNLIAEVGVAAGVGVKKAMEASGAKLGKITVLGTPAEEKGGGKIDLINKGAFDDVDIAMMAHPSTSNVAATNLVAAKFMQVTYTGRPSHAGACPWEGVNALDAAVMAYNSISAMRHQMKPDWRVHGIITNGGTRANVIPEKTSLDYCIKATTKADMAVLKNKVKACFDGSATVTGCSVEYDWSAKDYDNLVSNRTLVSLYSDECRRLGVTRSDPVQKLIAASTDMGNVSYVVPSIHPSFYIGTKFPQHTNGFREAAGTAEAQTHTLNQAKALAMLTLNVYFHPDLLQQIQNDFVQDMKNDSATG